MCKQANEIVDHLFLSCPIVSSILYKINPILGREDAFENLNSLISYMLNQNTKTQKGMISFNNLVAFIWSICLERNRRLFQDTYTNGNNIWDAISNLIAL